MLDGREADTTWVATSTKVPALQPDRGDYESSPHRVVGAHPPVPCGMKCSRGSDLPFSLRLPPSWTGGTLPSVQTVDLAQGNRFGDYAPVFDNASPNIDSFLDTIKQKQDRGPGRVSQPSDPTT
jgi:hypothetical protein